MIAILKKNGHDLKRGAQAFFEHEAAGGVVLMLAAALALMIYNSPLTSIYEAFLATPVVVKVGALSLDKPLLLWINDGLMAIFFFVIGLEIKREIVEGRLSSIQRAALPVFAAVGGMAIPALVFYMLNSGDPEALKGWAIPTATDIAFALGVLALLGPRVPVTLKVFLLALAIIDDLGAIVIIALFYTSQLSVSVLVIAAVGCTVLAFLNARGVSKIAPYVLVGVGIWVCVLKSGVHATLAGVVIALFIPIHSNAASREDYHDEENASPLKRLEHSLSPWVAFGVMPLFAFANAGVSLKGLSSSSDLLAGIPLGIAAGLLIGKQIGIFGATWAVVKLGIARMPEGVTWLQIYGVSIIAGIGFTMSLFIGALAYTDPAHAAGVRIGVLAGSVLSALLGILVLRLATFGVTTKPRAATVPEGSSA